MKEKWRVMIPYYHGYSVEASSPEEALNQAERIASGDIKCVKEIGVPGCDASGIFAVSPEDVCYEI